MTTKRPSPLSLRLSAGERASLAALKARAVEALRERPLVERIGEE